MYGNTAEMGAINTPNNYEAERSINAPTKRFSARPPKGHEVVAVNPMNLEPINNFPGREERQREIREAIKMGPNVDDFANIKDDRDEIWSLLGHENFDLDEGDEHTGSLLGEETIQSIREGRFKKEQVHSVTDGIAIEDELLRPETIEEAEDTNDTNETQELPSRHNKRISNRTGSGFSESDEFDKQKYGHEETLEEKLVDLDEDDKIRTGKSPEMVAQLAQSPYTQVFGKSRAVKALERLYPETNIDSAAEELLEIDKMMNGRSLPPDERFMKQLEVYAQTYKKEALDAKKAQELLDRLESDKVLSVGEPFMIASQSIGEGVDEIDYAFKHVHEARNLRTPEDMYAQLEGLFEGERGLTGVVNYMDMIRYALDTTPELRDRENIQEFYDTTIAELEQMAELLNNGASKENLQALQTVARKIKALIAQRLSKKNEERLQNYIDKEGMINYEETGDVADAALKGLTRLTNNIEASAPVLEKYMYEVGPKFVQHYIEDIADAHVNPPTYATEDSLKQYYEAWAEHLKSQGIDPEEYDEFTDPRFVDRLGDFVLNKGVGNLENLDPYLYKQMQDQLTQNLQAELPLKSNNATGETIEGVYPYCEKLKGKKYDRIVASCSVSMHSMPHLEDEEIKDIFHKTLDMLNDEGKFVLFPIGFYTDGNGNTNTRGQIDNIIAQLEEEHGYRTTAEWKNYYGVTEGQARGHVLILTKE